MTASSSSCDKKIRMRRRARSRAVLAAFALGAASLASAGEASAKPQVGAAVTSGVAMTDFRADNGPRVAAHLGGRFDALFLRERPTDMALGPHLEVMTAAFDTFEVGGGLSWLLPVGAPALVLGAGGFARSSRFGWEPGLAATIFWGARSFNYHGVYGLSAGLFAQGRYGLGDGKQADAIAGVQVDLGYLALPFIFAFEAIRR